MQPVSLAYRLNGVAFDVDAVHRSFEHEVSEPEVVDDCVVVVVAELVVACLR